MVAKANLKAGELQIIESTCSFPGIQKIHVNLRLEAPAYGAWQFCCVLPSTAAGRKESLMAPYAALQGCHNAALELEPAFSSLFQLLLYVLTCLGALPCNRPRSWNLWDWSLCLCSAATVGTATVPLNRTHL